MGTATTIASAVRHNSLSFRPPICIMHHRCTTLTAFFVGLNKKSSQILFHVCTAETKATAKGQPRKMTGTKEQKNNQTERGGVWKPIRGGSMSCAFPSYPLPPLLYFASGSTKWNLDAPVRSITES